MANTNLTPDIITKEIGTVFHNNIAFTRLVDRQYDDSNQMGGQKNGGAIRVRLPDQFTVTSGAALGTPPDVIERAVTLPQGTQEHVSMNFTSEELTYDIDEFSRRKIQPAVAKLAAHVDYKVMENVTQQVSSSVGTPGTTPATALVLLQGNEWMHDFAAPADSRCAVVNPAANAALINGLSGLFNAQDKISNQFKSGFMANNVLGYKEIAMSQSTYVHTCGTRTASGAVLVNDTYAAGETTISMDGGTGSMTITKGDVFTIAGVYSVNPETGQSTGKLMQLVCTATNTATTGAWTDVAFSPALYASDSLKNVDALPADNAAVTFVGTASTSYPQNLAFDSNSIIVATTDLEMPKGVDMSGRHNMDGISLRFVRQYRVGTDDSPSRIDVLYASVLYRDKGAVRIWG